ncbi:hypothetical protein GHK92_10675 [Nocardioides sp. dk4132]|uniref:hypothetical protein n=1 Tax=unclassified Nocardioides TaxID=2615069 RepID=UPI001296F6FE|nr:MULTISPECIES: hypothetical protein [unclassified Nocardioides]MQW76341.1 hypothetical protein [Nocardioides sp. dk4132]QGA07380.1 hypothetical protein GFH29_08245 [Nocardioides sp. dk884]
MSPGLVRATALVSLLGCLLLLMHALVLGLHVEGTPRALDDAARGERVGYPAALGAVLAVGALLGARHRRAATVAAVLALVLGATALVLDLSG